MSFYRSKLAWTIVLLVIVDLFSSFPGHGFSIHDRDTTDEDPDDPSYRCLHFSSNNPSSRLDYARFGSKSTYLNVRDQVRHTFNMTWPFDPRDCYPVYLFLIVRHT